LHAGWKGLTSQLELLVHVSKGVCIHRVREVYWLMTRSVKRAISLIEADFQAWWQEIPCERVTGFPGKRDRTVPAAATVRLWRGLEREMHQMFAHSVTNVHIVDVWRVQEI
jgi:hypothetical protein